MKTLRFWISAEQYLSPRKIERRIMAVSVAFMSVAKGNPYMGMIIIGR